MESPFQEGIVAGCNSASLDAACLNQTNEMAKSPDTTAVASINRACQSTRPIAPPEVIYVESNDTTGGCLKDDKHQIESVLAAAQSMERPGSPESAQSVVDDTKSEVSSASSDEELSDVDDTASDYSDEEAETDTDMEESESVSSDGEQVSSEKARGYGKRKHTRDFGPRAKKKTHRLFDMKNLYDTDPFAEPSEVSNAAAKFINQSNRKEALKQLFAGQKDLRGKDITQTQFNEACKSFVPRGAVKMSDTGWLLQGMRKGLLHHQLLGAGALRRMERSPELPRGGILADQMGLGKTVMMIANIVNGLKDKETEGGRSSTGTTLVVVPTSDLMHQWFDEFRDFVNTKKKFKVWRLEPGIKLDTSDIKKKFRECRVVVTTYAEVFKSFPDLEKPSPFATENEQVKFDKAFARAKGAIHRFLFYRVVLDECQTMKNHLTRIAQACCAIQAPRRWLISGTPLQDKPEEELFSYFRFLKYPGVTNMRSFQKNFPAGGRRDNLTLFDALQKIIIRRTSENTILNRPIADIPRPRRRDMVFLCLRQTEFEWYNILWSHVKSALHKIRDMVEDPKQKKELVLKVLLRARQMRTHPLLLASILPKLSQSEDMLIGLLQSCSTVPLEKTQIESMLRFIRNVGRQYHKHIIDVRESSRRINEQKIELLALTNDTPLKKINYARQCIKDAEEELKKLHGQAPKFKLKDWLKATKGIMLNSTLTNSIQHQFEIWQKNEPGCKVVIFTHFIAVADILEELFKQRGWTALPYHGSVSKPRRRQNLKKFKEESYVLALICTPKTGGVGLNLTEASRVMIVDMWWNKAVDDQAAARVYRIGQTKETEIVTFTMENTIDGHIRDLQRQKSARIASVLEGNGRRTEGKFIKELVSSIATEDESSNLPNVDAKTIEEIFPGLSAHGLTQADDEMDLSPEVLDESDSDGQENNNNPDCSLEDTHFFL